MVGVPLTRRRVMQLLAAGMTTSAAGAGVGLAAPVPELPGPKPVFIAPGAGHKGHIAVNEVVFKLSKDQTAGNLGSSETTLYPGYMGAPPHRHQHFDEVCRVLEGTLTILVGEEVFTVEAGGWHLRPRGIVHSFWNSGKVPAKFIDLYLPGGHEAYMLELTTLFENGRTPKPADMAALARKHDIEFFWDQLPTLMQKYRVHL